MSVEEFQKCACVHCGQHIEFPVEAAGQTVPCPQCQQPTALSVLAPIRSNRNWRWGVVVALLLAVAGGAVFLLQHSSDGEVAARSSVLPDPPPADLQRRSQLAFWDFAIERKEDSTITHAVARMLNESDTTRYGIEVQLELLDRDGLPMGTAKDYIERLEPGQDAHVRALVVKRDAVSARVVGITEQ